MATGSPANDNEGTRMPIPRRWAVLASFVAVCAAVLSTLFFPMLGLRMRRPTAADEPRELAVA